MNHARALQDDVEFILSRVGMRRMFLTGLEGIQAREKKIAVRQVAFAHPVRRELGEAGDLFYKHALQFTRRRHGILSLGRASYRSPEVTRSEHGAPVERSVPRISA